MTRLESVEAGFATETAEHVLTVVRDDGLYRHITCGKPGTGIYAWEIITWPGRLAITGDLGSYIFQRVDDMLRNFFSGNINPEYWLEKCTSYARPIRVVSVDTVRDQAEYEMAELKKKRETHSPGERSVERRHLDSCRRRRNDKLRRPVRRLTRDRHRHE